MKKTIITLVFLLLNIFLNAQTVIPFHLVDGYILVSAQVNEVKGKFLFDTGTESNFFLNNNLIPLKKENYFGDGKTGSGQLLHIYKGNIDSIKIFDSLLVFEDLKNVFHTNFDFMQDSISSDILGTIGYETLKNYVFTIDYNRQIILLDSKNTKHNYPVEKTPVLAIGTPRSQ